ncbi:MAG: 16S rRNA (adenine(1518)-N(6)/adenine(1519)-N(6))-dimethyltransferase, partial [Planctomycetota bacterium]|nr:16S rRNA (adenine(1518)-N(6)/adenine(1519)-N(6))-dimethyltransferase [Planctomycetota bacterium]
MQTLSEIRAVLAERGIRPKHRLGQHFLHDKNQVNRLVHAAGVQPGDVVLEVGPGTGALTEALLDRGAEVIACEVDRNLAAIIADRFGPRVRLICGDCLLRHRA